MLWLHLSPGGRVIAGNGKCLCTGLCQGSLGQAESVSIFFMLQLEPASLHNVQFDPVSKEPPEEVLHYPVVV